MKKELAYLCTTLSTKTRDFLSLFTAVQKFTESKDNNGNSEN